MVVSRIWNLLKQDVSRESWAPGFRSGRKVDFAEVHSDGYTLECMGVKVEEASLGLKNCLSLEFNLTFVAAQLATEYLSRHLAGPKVGAEELDPKWAHLAGPKVGAEELDPKWAHLAGP